MDSKELVRRAIEFDYPERIPLRYCTNIEKGNLIILPIPEHPDFSPGEPGLDEWGCLWKKMGEDIGQVVRHPVSCIEDLSKYKLPIVDIEKRFKEIKEKISFMQNKFVVGDMETSGFTRMSFLRGFDSLLCDIYTNGELFDRLADIVFSVEEELIKGWHYAGASGIYFRDDWGTQENLIISPEMWKKLFMPRYKQQVEIIHNLGMKAMFHSCGKVNAIIGFLIEIGFDVFNSNQIELLGIQKIADEYAGKICFLLPVDIQRTLMEGSIEDIRNMAVRLARTFGNSAGGFIGVAELADFEIAVAGTDKMKVAEEGFSSVEY